MTVFEAARQADCVQAAEKLGIRTRRSGGKAYACCLFHAERTPSLCLYPDSGGFYCFGCHAHGDAVALYAQALSVTSDTLLGLDKTGMERTLNLKEQRILTAFRNATPEMQSAMYQLFVNIDNISGTLHEKNTSLELAEEFIKRSGMQDEWKEMQREAMPAEQ